MWVRVQWVGSACSVGTRIQPGRVDQLEVIAVIYSGHRATIKDN